MKITPFKCAKCGYKWNIEGRLACKKCGCIYYFGYDTWYRWEKYEKWRRKNIHAEVKVLLQKLYNNGWINIERKLLGDEQTTT